MVQTVMMVNEERRETKGTHHTEGRTTVCLLGSQGFVVLLTCCIIPVTSIFLDVFRSTATTMTQTLRIQ